MDQPLSILIIEDDPRECQELISCIEARGDCMLVGVTNNAEKALEHALASQPDAIILDLELQMGRGNGLAFLDSMQGMRLPRTAYVLVTTHNTSVITHQAARQLGADFIMAKSQEDYSADSVVDFLCSLKGLIQSQRQAAQEAAPPTPEQQQKAITAQIITELDRIGIPPNALGRKYLIDAIGLVAEGKTERICSSLASKYAKTEASIERAMQNAITRAWQTSFIGDLERHYTARISSERGVPTLMEFIYYYAEKIRLAS